MSTFVLVPGMWLGGWAWDEVADRLRADGHVVRQVTLVDAAGRTGARPYKVAVDAGRDLALDRYSRQQPAADVAVRDGADHTPFGVMGKQDPEHVGIEPLECLLDRVALGDGKVTLVWQCGGSKAATGSGFGPETPLFSGRRYGRGADRARLPMAR